MKSDIEIARSIELKKIKQVAESVDIPRDEVENYGRYIAKIPTHLIDEEKVKKSNLILVTAITATKAGIGKTTVSIGLALGLNKIGKKAIVALREPSLGPCFGMKGGAAGGGYAQVLPMEKINLHFTGDFHAITSAHNMISALLDNYLYQHQADGFGLKEIIWRRVLDVMTVPCGALSPDWDRAPTALLRSRASILPRLPKLWLFSVWQQTSTTSVAVLKILFWDSVSWYSFHSEGVRSSRCHYRTVERCYQPQLGTDYRRLCCFCSWRTVRKYCPWLQLHSCHKNGHDIRRLCSDGSRFRS